MSDDYFIIEQNFPFKAFVGNEEGPHGVPIVESIREAREFNTYQEAIDFIDKNEWKKQLEKEYIEIVPCV